jgi:hypothetical protein
MNKKIIAGIAAAGLGIATFGSVADARPSTPADSACLLAGLTVLKGLPPGSIGATASTSSAGTVAFVITEHLAGNDPVTLACSSQS